ncbi:MAG: BON domain-containing protein [Betaproteobacteria bacterium]|nr:BON domain-containing protein [Betaproteobacteria bacterium]
MKTSFAVKALGALLLVSTLGACAPLMIAGVAGTAMVASDRRTSGAQLEDESIELRAQARIRDNLGERVHVNVTSFNRQVLLTGEVTAEKDRQAVLQLVERIEDSRDLFASAFKVVTERGTVYLMGRVTQREATSATQVTRNVSGVNKVVRLFEIISEDELRNLLPPPPAPADAAKPAK